MSGKNLKSLVTLGLEIDVDTIRLNQFSNNFLSFNKMLPERNCRPQR